MHEGRLSAFSAPGLVTLVALVTRFCHLDANPFWLDEVLTVNRARLPTSALVLDAFHNLHFPTYFLLVSPLADAVDTEWSLRAPSALFGALVAGLACVIGQSLQGRMAGIAAGLLTALSPFQVQFSQEARSYTLVALLIMLALWGLLQIAVAGEAGLPSRRGPWIAYSAGTLLALLVHNSALMWLLAANLAAICMVFCRRGNRGAFLRRWFMAQGAIVGIWLPCFLAMLPYLAKTATSGYWIPPATVKSIWAATKAVYLFRISDSVMFELGPRIVPGLGLLLLLLFLAGLWQLRRMPSVLAVLLCAALVLPMGLLLASALQPVFLPRYLLWAAPPLFVLAGTAVSAIPSRSAALANLLLGLVLAWNLLPYYAFESKPRWDLTARYIARHARPGDVILLRNFNSRLVYKFYRDRFGPPLEAVPRVLEVSEATVAMQQGHRVWAILGRSGFGPMPTPQAYLQEAAALGAPAEQRRFGSHVVLFRFDPERDR